MAIIHGALAEICLLGRLGTSELGSKVRISVPFLDEEGKSDVPEYW